VQDEAGGIAQALGLAEHFCSSSRCCVLLGDNIFRDPLIPLIEKANSRPDWAWIGLKRVPDPGRYGVAELNGDAVLSIEEKPKQPKSDLAVVGIYIYPPDVFSVIKTLKPSGRGELEITDVNNYYLKQGRMGWSRLDGYWTDAGTLDSLDFANELVRKEAPRF
jgi:glucose-1-phosphate thymidylyltransferase